MNKFLITLTTVVSASLLLFGASRFGTISLSPAMAKGKLLLYGSTDGIVILSALIILIVLITATTHFWLLRQNKK